MSSCRTPFWHVSIAICLTSGVFVATSFAQEAPPRRNVHLQNDVKAAEKPLCGVHCLFVSLVALDIPVESLDVVQKRLGAPPRSGYSFAQLAAAAESFGLHATGVSTTLDRLAARKQRFACIGHVLPNHFVVIADIADGSVTYCDPPGMVTIPTLTFNTQWDGQALLIAHEPLVPEEDLEGSDVHRGESWLLGSAIVVGLAAAVFAGLRWKRSAERQ